MVSGRGLTCRSGEVFFRRLHVDVGFRQSDLCRHCALVRRAHQLLNAASLAGRVGLAHVGEQFADIGGGATCVSGQVPRFGIRLTSVGNDRASIGNHLTQIGFEATHTRHLLAHIRAGGPFVRCRLASVGLRFASIGNYRA